MSLSRHHAALSRPRSVEELVQEAQDFEFTVNRSLSQWLRAARMLLTEAAICEQEENLATAYLYLYRHAELILTRLPEHPQYRDPQYKQELSLARKTLQRNLVKLEQWKPRINQDHQHYIKAVERRNAERQRAQEQFNGAERQRFSYDGSRRGSLASLGDSPESPMQSLSANENREFAVNLAQRELRRRDATRQSTAQAGIPAATVAERRKGLVASNYDTHDGQRRASEGILEARRQLQRNVYEDQPVRGPSRHSTTTSYRYPTVPQKEGRIDWQSQPPTTLQLRNDPPPPRPAKESLYDYQASELPATGGPPPRPPRPDAYATTIAPPSPPSRSREETIPSKYTFKPTAFTESGAPLRTVLLPPELRTTFLNLAHPNTSRNLETCGILCGTIISNALFINHLVIPDQTSTSDTCDTTEQGEIELFDFCDSQNLLVCGWIHTHPSQTCFLSSRDLHTSSGYQVMLPEAIAIVCAPRHNPDWGIFRLTDPPGLPHVLECKQSGLFHPHSEQNLYTDALRPGHVVEGPGLKFDVVDLRKGVNRT